MIAEFVKNWEANKHAVEASLKASHPSSYGELVKLVIMAINPTGDYGLPDPDRIHAIDDGDYQGTLVYVIAEVGYQPSGYWCVMVDYGSCSGCDTLESIRGYSSDPVTEEQLRDYMTLALHIVQKLVKIPNPMYPD